MPLNKSVQKQKNIAEIALDQFESVLLKTKDYEYRVLVLDENTYGIWELLPPRKFLVARKKIGCIIQLPKHANVQPCSTPATYYLFPTPENIKYLQQFHGQSPIFPQANVHFAYSPDDAALVALRECKNLAIKEEVGISFWPVFQNLMVIKTEDQMVQTIQREDNFTEPFADFIEQFVTLLQTFNIQPQIYFQEKDPASMAAAQIVNSKINKGRGTDKVIILSRNIDQYEMFCMSSILGALAFDSCLTSDGRLKSANKNDKSKLDHKIDPNDSTIGKIFGLNVSHANESYKKKVEELYKKRGIRSDTSQHHEIVEQHLRSQLHGAKGDQLSFLLNVIQRSNQYRERFQKLIVLHQKITTNNGDEQLKNMIEDVKLELSNSALDRKLKIRLILMHLIQNNGDKESVVRELCSRASVKFEDIIKFQKIGIKVVNEHPVLGKPAYSLPKPEFVDYVRDITVRHIAEKFVTRNDPNIAKIIKYTDNVSRKRVSVATKRQTTSAKRMSMDRENKIVILMIGGFTWAEVCSMCAIQLQPGVRLMLVSDAVMNSEDYINIALNS